MGDEKSTDPFLRPPPHGEAETSWALLDLLAYTADRENSTSACGKMSNGKDVRVTFCTAPPPLVSYICVWCPDLEPADQLSVRSRIEAADSDLVLLSVSIRSVRGHCDCFLYKANGGKGTPSLRLVELPDDFPNTRYDIALVARSDVVSLRQQSEVAGKRFRLRPHGEGDAVERFGLRPHGEGDALERLGEGDAVERFRLRPHGEADSGFYVAALSHETDGVFKLWVFDSEGDQWTRKPVHVPCPFYHHTRKAINLGGGLVAFADPWQGIVVCDVLCRRPPRYMLLPPELVRNDRCDHPLLFRDIAVVEGRLTLIRLWNIGEPDTDRNCWSWEASTWSRKVTPLWEEDWRQDYVVQSGDVEVDMDAVDNVGLLPEVEDVDGVMKPCLEMRYTAHPTLSLSDSHVFHFMAKVGRLDKKALVLSIDLKKPRLLGLARFDAERMLGHPFSYAYMQSWIPRYFNPGVGETLKRSGKFHVTYPRKLHARSIVMGDEMYMPISGAVQEKHVTGSSKGAELKDNFMDVD
ncbi:hypothetical protein EJB05_50900 [Eragrostis curvula]|uniref:DUF1618 domain-containing protein n=1 Tax=Eragrostis curvula TaxID=38414 RepID=A0A5J9SX64_9POAL|nr:hypothetical protein EJB05_50900 [Eragrostis curvula]